LLRSVKALKKNQLKEMKVKASPVKSQEDCYVFFQNYNNLKIVITIQFFDNLV